MMIIKRASSWLPQKDRWELSSPGLLFLPLCSGEGTPVLLQPSGFSTENSSRQTGLKDSDQVPGENQKEMDKRNARHIKPSIFSGTRFRSDKTCFLAKPPVAGSLPVTLPVPACHCRVALGRSGIFSSKDLTSAFQLSWSQISLWGTPLIHTQSEFCDEEQGKIAAPSSDTYPRQLPENPDSV